MKKVQIGARVNTEDAEFLNLLEINGASTPSDKLRALIEEARMRREFSHDFTGSYRVIHEQLVPIIEKVKKIEFEKNIHSALLARIIEWLPEFYAYILSALPEEGESEDELAKYEKGAVDRVARLFESLLHLELSTIGSSYKQGVFKDHVSSLADLIRIIHTTSQNMEGEQ